MAKKYRALVRVNERTGIPMKDLRLAFIEYFNTVRSVFSEGEHPSIVITGLLSMQFSASALKRKANNLTQLILDENFSALKKRFRCDTIEEARLTLTEIIRIYKMKKNFDIINTQAKKRKYNGWDFQKRS